MSSVFHMARSGVESGLSGCIRARRMVHVHTAWPFNTNSLVFLLAIILFFSILGSRDMPDFVILLLLASFAMATTSFTVYTICQRLQAQAQADAAAAIGLLGHTEFRLHMPPSLAFATRGRSERLRLQLGLLDREVDDLDYETSRALHSDNASTSHSIGEQEINALPVCDYKVSVPRNEGSSLRQASSSSAPMKMNQDVIKGDSNVNASEDEPKCCICLEQVKKGELFCASGIDPWLHKQGTCAVCKLKAESGVQESKESKGSGDELV